MRTLKKYLIITSVMNFVSMITGIGCLYFGFKNETAFRYVDFICAGINLFLPCWNFLFLVKGTVLPLLDYHKDILNCVQKEEKDI